MSTRLTATGITVAPAGAVGVTLTGVTYPDFSAWVEVIAASAGVVAAAGIVIDGGTYSNKFMEFEIGVGAVGVEVAVARVHGYAPNSGNAQPRIRMLSVPITVGPAGSRVALRYREGGGGAVTALLLYYEDLDSAHVATVALAGVPTGNAVVTVTPSATPWAWSSWGVVRLQTPREFAITGITAANPVSCDLEWEIGTGAAGAEVGITRIRAGSPTNLINGQIRAFSLAAPLPIAVGSRLALRLRKSGTSVTAQRAQLFYLDGTELLAPPVAPEAVAFVSRAECASVLTGGATSKATAAATHTDGRLLVVFVSVQSANAVTVTDTAGNSYQQAGSTVTSGTNRLRIYYAYDCYGHASNVVTATLASGTGNYFAISVREFAGDWWAPPTVATGSGTTAGASPVTSSTVDIPDGVSSAFVAGCLAGGGGGGMGSGTGLTVSNFASGAGAGYFADGHEIASADQACGFTYTGSGGGVIAAAFTPNP